MGTMSYWTFQLLLIFVNYSLSCGKCEPSRSRVFSNSGIQNWSTFKLIVWLISKSIQVFNFCTCVKCMWSTGSNLVLLEFRGCNTVVPALLKRYFDGSFKKRRTQADRSAWLVIHKAHSDIITAGSDLHRISNLFFIDVDTCLWNITPVLWFQPILGTARRAYASSKSR